MPPPPKGKQPPETPPGRTSDRTSDRTSTVVVAGLALLAVLGVLTVFSGPLMALVAPPAADQGAVTEPTRPPPPPPAAGDAGAPSPSVGRADDGGHS